jgi:hypothetical protein
MNSEKAASWPIVESDHGERFSALEPPLREEVEYSQATAGDTMEQSTCLAANASGEESDGEDERPCRSKRGSRRKLNEVCSDKNTCSSVWSDARSSITSQTTPVGATVESSYPAAASLTPLGFSALEAWNPPVESVTFDCNTAAFSLPKCGLSSKRRRLTTYSETPIRDDLSNAYKKAGNSLSRNRLWSEPGDSEANGSDCTEEDSNSNDSDLVVLSGLVARATNMLEDAVAYRSDSYVSKFLEPEDLRENMGEEEVYDPHNSFKPLKKEVYDPHNSFKPLKKAAPRRRHYDVHY